MRRASASLMVRIALLVAALVAALAAGLGAYLPRRLDAVSRRWAESGGLGVGRLLAGACEAPLDFEDPAGAARALGTLARSRGARGAVVLGADGAPFAEWSEAPVGPSVALGAEATSWLGSRLRVRVPVITRAGRRGALVVDFTGEELDERRIETRHLLATALGLALLLGIAAAAAVGAFTARPLQRMTAVARRIAAGDLAARAELTRTGGAEPEALADALDVMLSRLLIQQEQLAEHARDIQAVNAELEVRVADRTDALNAANRELSQRIEELRRTQDQLIVADRRVSLGRMAAGVAHEINNPLAYVLSNLAVVDAALTEAQLQAGAQGAPQLRIDLADTAAAVRDARDGAERVRTIVRGLKAFARGDEDERQVIDPGEALRAAVQMAAHEIRTRARLEVVAGPLPQVQANAVRLSQVLLNLLVNAAQAIPEGAPERHLVRVVTRTAADGWAELEISDSGAGIPRENLTRIFDPFFTTKPVGVGTGLGLSISHGIVSQLGGSIEVESELGRGATFRVRLPPRPRQGGVVAEPEAPAPAPLRGGRVLVVDDEPLVQASVRRVLGPGLEVVPASDGNAALARLAAGDRFDAVICDLAMPGMDGVDLYEALSRRHPEVLPRVLFVTGGATTERARVFVAGLGGRVLEKPVEPDRLRRAVDAILAA